MSKNQKDVMVQIENRFLPDPCLEMETETKALSCFLWTNGLVLWTSICRLVFVCVLTYFAALNIQGRERIYTVLRG